MNLTAIISFIALIASYFGWQWKIHERTTTLGLQLRTCEDKNDQQDERLTKVEAEQRDLRDSHIRLGAQMPYITEQLAKMDSKLDRLIESKLG
jgi:hypothetical protein